LEIKIMRHGKTLAIIAFLALSGCGHVPVTSLLSLSRIDLATTDPAQLRAAVKLPEALRPLPRSMVLHVTVRKKDGQELTEGFALQEISAAAEARPLQAEAEAGMQIVVYRLDPAELPHVAAFRAQALAQQAAGGGLTIQPEACRTAALPPGPLLISTYLRTVETGGYVPLTRGIDLRDMTRGYDLATVIPPCT
jgi:hypothetical protein